MGKKLTYTARKGYLARYDHVDRRDNPFKSKMWNVFKEQPANILFYSKLGGQWWHGWDVADKEIQQLEACKTCRGEGRITLTDNKGEKYQVPCTCNKAELTKLKNYINRMIENSKWNG